MAASTGVHDQRETARIAALGVVNGVGVIRISPAGCRRRVLSGPGKPAPGVVDLGMLPARTQRSRWTGDEELTF